METWNGFRMLQFTFEDRKAILVFPNNAKANKPWLFKMEYWNAFPGFEKKMVEQGYHLAYVANKTRWCLDEDLALKRRFCDYLSKTYDLCSKCVPVGMSCGGMFSVKFAAYYPQYVAVMYLDAPVMNLLSCPADIGIGNSGLFPEFTAATNISLSELISYRKHPIDYIPKLIEQKIPIALVCGGADTTVPYSENGAILEEYYKNSDIPFYVEIKPDCGHHPHGLEDPTRICEFISNHSK